MLIIFHNQTITHLVSEMITAVQVLLEGQKRQPTGNQLTTVYEKVERGKSCLPDKIE